MMNPSGNLARFEQLAAQLLAERNNKGFWTGQLSSSALAVSVSVIAFHFYNTDELHADIRNGICWLINNQNQDGGFGDSPQSLSNISTSLLSYSALHITKDLFPESDSCILGLTGYLRTAGIDVNSPDVARHVLDFYQKDYTFSVPILATCALCGIPGENSFKPIPQLPFELALLPRGFYRFLNLNVVSYAIPALVAVGIAIFQHKKSGRLTRLIRKRSIPKVMALLEKIMPESGGFLEAIPLTAFVALSLIKSGYRDHPVVAGGIGFLRRMQREDGSWPIDIDLSNWITTLAVKSFRNQVGEYIDIESGQAITSHLLFAQNQGIHPFNGSTAGGWGWTNHSGSVPDGDDTPGAILALLSLNPEPANEVVRSVIAGCNWLIQLQNHDGGFPTFSKGWGKLPFDQSCSDLTGHAVLALSKAIEKAGKFMSSGSIKKYRYAIRKGTLYLKKSQGAEGEWLPLWFGNQFQSKQHNPVYGTARVTAYLTDSAISQQLSVLMKDDLNHMIQKAQGYLMKSQNPDGSWGGDAGLDGTIEETALAVAALVNQANAKSHCESGLIWLDNQELPLRPAPIGLYFASLWYDDKLYPLVMYTEALSAWNQAIALHSGSQI
ncbi:MAG: prenyltransferase/squalene oxidase repeat-containing protein [Bacteroidales bacterium]|nr:prenyltransferase/squalene oxidase repeat-containing protein [Bacteroidales bacterium]